MIDSTDVADSSGGGGGEAEVSPFIKFLIGFACSIVILLSLLGNMLVVTVILRFKRLKNATNYILLSLAIADISVALLVMIPGTIQDVQQKWMFSQLFCKFWISFDISCCTASILHLLLVAIDRYIAIFKPLTYRNIFRTWHVFTAVVLMWILSFAMSFIPIFMGWNNNSPDEETGGDHSSALTAANTSAISPAVDTASLFCTIEANIPYAIISSSLSFYVPFFLMTIVYIQIYIVAKRQAKAIAQIDLHTRNLSNDSGQQHHQQQQQQQQQNSLQPGNSVSNGGTSNGDLKQRGKKKSVTTESGSSGGNRGSDMKNRFLRLVGQLKTIERKRTKDTKAIKTLGIIMGVFVAMWLPFFYMYLSVPITKKPYPLLVERLITWIGYLNSFINPIIYALTNRDFRKAYFTTFKTLTEQLCPQAVYDSTFGRREREYLGINARVSKRRNDARSRCACLSCLPTVRGRRASAGEKSCISHKSNNRLNSMANHDDLVVNQNGGVTGGGSAKESFKLKEIALTAAAVDLNNNADRVENKNLPESSSDKNDKSPATLPPQQQQQDTVASTSNETNALNFELFSENINEFDYIDLDVLSKELGSTGGEASPERRSLLIARYRSGMRNSAGLASASFDLPEASAVELVRLEPHPETENSC